MPVVRELITRWGFAADTAKVTAFNKEIAGGKVAANESASAYSGLTAVIGKYIAAIGIVGIATKKALDTANFKDAMLNTMTIVEATGDKLAAIQDGLEKKARELSDRFGISAQEIGGAGFFQVLTDGAQPATKEFDALAETGIKVAKLTNQQVAPAIEGVTALLHGFNIEATDAPALMDKFFKAGKLGMSTNVPQMMAALRIFGPTARLAKMDISEAIAVLGGFAKVNLKGEAAGESLNMFLTKLQTPTPTSEPWLQKMGWDMHDPKNHPLYDATGKMRPLLDIIERLQHGVAKLSDAQRNEAMKELFGERIWKKFAGILNLDIETLRKFRTEIAGAGGDMDQALAVKMDSPIGKFNKLKENIKNSSIELLEGLIPAVNEFMADLLQGVTDNKEAIHDFATGAVADLGETIKWIGKYRTALEDAAKIVVTIWAGVTIAGWLPALAKIVGYVIGALIPAFTQATVAVAAFAGEGATIFTVLAGSLALVVGGIVALAAEIGGIIYYMYSAIAAWQQADALIKAQGESRVQNGKTLSYYAEIDRMTGTGNQKGTKEQRNAYVKARNAGKTADEAWEIAFKDENDANAKMYRKGKDAGTNWMDGLQKGLKDGKDKAEDELKFLHPGFDKGTMQDFAEFIRSGYARKGGGEADQIGAWLGGRKVPLETFGGKAGGGVTHDNRTYNINGAQDPAAVAAEIGRLDRGNTLDFLGPQKLPVSSIQPNL